MAALLVAAALVAVVQLRRRAPPEAARLLPGADGFFYVNLKWLRTLKAIGPLPPVAHDSDYEVFLHETGHALFNMLKIPVLGREEDAAAHNSNSRFKIWSTAATMERSRFTSSTRASRSGSRNGFPPSRRRARRRRCRAALPAVARRTGRARSFAAGPQATRTAAATTVAGKTRRVRQGARARSTSSMR